MSEERWLQLEAELRRWHQQGLRCQWWWRDDDLIAATGALWQMHELAEEFRINVLVAVIPALMQDDLHRKTVEMQRFCFCQHGYAHQNHASGGNRSEFPVSRPLETMVEELQRGAMLMKAQFGLSPLPVLVPPWNDICDNVALKLSASGFAGLSRYGMRFPSRQNSLLRADCHVDVADWAAAPRFRDEHEVVLLDRLIAELQERRHEAGTEIAPLGILTHHRAMDERAWRFVRHLLQLASSIPSIEWLSPRDLFSSAAG